MSTPLMTDAENMWLKSLLLNLAGAIAKDQTTKIDAIRAHRAATGSTLKDSKDWVVALADATDKAKADRDIDHGPWEGGSKSSSIDDRLTKLENAIERLPASLWVGERPRIG